MKIKWERESIVSKVDGLNLDVLVTRPEGRQIKGVVQICHGMSENKERYLPFMEHLSRDGYACIIHDHRGHGKSIRESNDLGYMYGGCGQTLVEETAQITRCAKDYFPGVPLVLMGHSMGALIVRNYMKMYDNEPDVLIICGPPSRNPGVKAGRAIALFQRWIHGDRYRSKLIEAMSFGAYTKRFRKEKNRFAWICSDEAVVTEYQSSKLCGFMFTLDGYLALFDLMEGAYSKKGWNCNHVNMPILFIAGAEDPCINNVKKFNEGIDQMRHIGYRNIDRKLYPGLRHEILNEREKERVFSDIYSYINKYSGVK